MGKVAIIVVGMASFLGIFVSIGARRNINSAQTQTAEHQHEILARNAALACHNQAVQKLADSFESYPPYYGTFDGVDHFCTVDVANGRAVVHAVGTSVDAVGELVRFNVRAEYESFSQPSGIAEEAPPFMGYAVLSEESILLNGNIEADICAICVDGTEALTLNANMHTNQSLHVQGNSALVKGFGTYVGTGSSNPKKALANTFKPNYNPSNAPTTQRTPAITLPVFSASAMALALMPDSVSNGDVVLTGNKNLGGTREDPYVWHVKGNMTASGGATLDGYVLVLVEGNVTFNGNLDAGGDPGYDGPDESSVAFYADGDVTFGGNVAVWGQVFANGDVWFHGTPDVYGNVTTAGRLNFGGNVEIYYRRASPALTTYWNGTTLMRLQRLAYSEW